jgi:hypothetical protein
MQKKRAIASARAFLNLPSFDLIVSILDLQPKGSWDQWEDAEGNYLKISKNKSIRVFLPKKDTLTTRDIYRKAHPRMIAKHSYWILALFGKNQSIISFLGNDGILRCCYFENNIWKYNISPLLLGFDILKCVISEYLELDSRKLQLVSVKHPKSFKIEEVWASGIPANDFSLQERIECHLINQNLVEP